MPPASSTEEAQEAAPAETGAAAQSVAAPSRKATVPVGVSPGPPTVAVKVTGVPCAEGVPEVASRTVAAPLFTVWLRGAEVAARWLGLPP